jgi:hypothetical protein
VHRLGKGYKIDTRATAFSMIAFELYLSDHDAPVLSCGGSVCVEFLHLPFGIKGP